MESNHMSGKRFSLAEVEKKLQIKGHTLRTWENRYKIICPERTESNIRLYTEEQVDLLEKIILLKQNGYKLKSIAKWDKQAIIQKASDLINQDHLADHWIQELLDATLHYDKTKIEYIFDQINKHYSMDRMILDVLLPLFDHFNLLWLTGSMHALHERFLGQLVYNRMTIEVELIRRQIKTFGKSVLLFSPDRAQKAYLLKIIQYFLKTQHCRVNYFGCGISAAEIEKIVVNISVDEVYILVSEDAVGLDREKWLSQLTRVFPSQKIRIVSHPQLKEWNPNLSQIQHYKGINELAIFLTGQNNN